jgi:CBS domain-containing protein
MKASHPMKAIDPGKVLARDVMRTDVLTLLADDSIRDAAEQLEEIHASGAAVVDDSGRLLGVLTLSDIARSEHVDDQGVATRLRAELEPDRSTEVEGVDEDLFETDDFRDRVVGRVRIADWMSQGVTSVSPKATLAAVCRIMLDEDIHRVFVLDGDRLCGVISTKDVVRVLASPVAADRQPA